eukprot:7368397-Prymnesium_polylepis.1
MPKAESAAQAARLQRTIRACAASSVEHVVLRSSMGVACAARCADDDALPDVAAEAGCDVDSARAIERMGGDAYLATAGQSEKELA